MSGWESARSHGLDAEIIAYWDGRVHSYDLQHDTGRVFSVSRRHYRIRSTASPNSPSPWHSFEFSLPFSSLFKIS
jgi:hypothetical protein